MTDLEEINRKLDLILDSLGLSAKPRLSPAQLDEKVKADVLRFKNRRCHADDSQKG